jgi:hypothetical protein
MPRQCRICLEVIYPTVSTPVSGLSASFQPRPELEYRSSDPDLGRLLKPCKCKGSSRYVHEGCLSAWRHADPSYGRRNYYECPTCHYSYRLERLQYARYIDSRLTQLGLTIAILLVTMFLLGFVADPIFNLYSDPLSTISSPKDLTGVKTRIVIAENAVSGWYEHFLKGLASLGLLGFIKVLWAMGPSGWFNMRNSGLLGGRNSGRTGATGRERAANVSWIVIMIGVGTTMLVSTNAAG